MLVLQMILTMSSNGSFAEHNPEVYMEVAVDGRTDNV
jgi:hypothetical protein